MGRFFPADSGEHFLYSPVVVFLDTTDIAKFEQREPDFYIDKINAFMEAEGHEPWTYVNFFGTAPDYWTRCKGIRELTIHPSSREDKDVIMDMMLGFAIMSVMNCTSYYGQRRMLILSNSLEHTNLPIVRAFLEKEMGCIVVSASPDAIFDGEGGCSGSV